ncbi:serendipity locus protein delta-like [Musca vetustissima]|uniref:serendipity locus protein delta-like n=1 Tax=Musca vetustissima TaxID=27455 RepID=UPI002AB5EF70|nr:serendipity locus protein delta-like [Musca vetustissima]
MESVVCFLCTDNTSKSNDDFYDVLSAIVPYSQKPLHVVLQHLANCLKYKLIFQSGTYICGDCFRELASYDDLMLNLLNSQRRLTSQLHYALAEKGVQEQLANEEPIQIELEFEGADQTLEDAFNPNLDTKEELIEVDDDVIEEVVDDSTGGFCNSSGQTNFHIVEVTSTGGERKRNQQDCPMCGAIFTSKYLLQSHINEIHSGKQFTCKICGVTRKDEEYLELHMNIHEGKTENECRYCPKKFSRPVNTLRHMRVHWDKKKFQCEKCGERFSLDNMLYNHRLRHEAEDNPVICSICNQSFKSRKTYNHHIIIHQENRPRHQCTLCPKSFTERYTLKMHLKNHNDRQSPTSTVEIKQSPSLKDPKEETEEAINLLVSAENVNNSCVVFEKKYDEKVVVDHHLNTVNDVILKS